MVVQSLGLVPVSKRKSGCWEVNIAKRGKKKLVLLLPPYHLTLGKGDELTSPLVNQEHIASVTGARTISLLVSALMR
jgi:hypothetical protein